MRSNKAKIIDYYYRIPYARTVIDFEEILIYTIMHSLNMDRIEAERIAFRYKNMYWNDLLSQIQEDQKKGTKPVFEVVDSQLKRLVLYPDMNKIVSTKEKRINSLIKSRPLILNEIDLLNDREYEALACLCCSLLGANNILLTPKGNEGGIDFLATIKFPERSHFLFGIKGPIRIVGQCKKYSDRVQVDKIKEFVSTLDEIKNQNPVVERIIPPWFRISQGAIIGWVISHSGFQSGSITKSQNHGIILSDSIDIAQLISLSNNYFCSETPNNRAKELKSSVRKYL